MSTRTIIEINHDYLHDLLKSPEHFAKVLYELQGTDITGALNYGRKPNLGLGVRVLAQRHHSEELTLTIK